MSYETTNVQVIYMSAVQFRFIVTITLLAVLFSSVCSVNSEGIAYLHELHHEMLCGI